MRILNKARELTNSANTTDIDVGDFTANKIGHFIWVYVSPLLLLVGVVGNTLSVLVLLRKALRSSTTMFYLIFLSVGDILTLYTGLLRYWISNAFDIDVRNISDTGCKIHTFLVYLSLDFTVWVLVSVTVDRCLSVSMPFRTKRICTIWRSKLIVIFIVFVLSLKNMHFLWNLELSYLRTETCNGKSESIRQFYRFVWPWIDFSTFCLIPFSIMIFCNIKIIYHMVISQRKVKAHQNLYGNSPATPTGDTCELTETDERGTGHHVLQTRNNRNTVSTQKRKQPGAIPRVTATLLTVNFVFLVTTTPIQVFLIGQHYWFQDKTPRQVALHNIWWAIVNILQYSNNCVHFFLYCLTSPRFRYALKCMFRRKNKVSGGRGFVSNPEK